MTSLWLDRAGVGGGNNTVPGSIPNAEVLVVGAGITGLVTAVLLARGGKRVVVVEAISPGACTTGHTTGKISLLQGTRLSTIARRHSADLLRHYVDGNREGQAWLLQYCSDRGIEVQYEDAITYAQGNHGLSAVRAEYEACRTAGLDVDWIDHLDVPFPFRAGVRLARQAQFDPMPLLNALVAELRDRGGRLVTGCRVYAASAAGGRIRLALHDADGEDVDTATADQCVLATGIPILDRGGFFARLQPSRSYCVAFTMPAPIWGVLPGPMMLSADSPSRSLRYATATTPAGTEQLIVGGAGHVVGRKEHPWDSYNELVAWTRRYFPGAEPTHYWSAQDYVPLDGLPYVGPLLPGSDHFFVATGFAKWGMTNSVAAGVLLAKRILGGEPAEWGPAFDSWSTHELTGLTTGLKLNLEVGWQLASGWTRHLLGRAVPCLDRDGDSPVCTHLGGILTWNDAENSWDCPLHGSRFSSDGSVLEGPATRDLPGFRARFNRAEYG